MSTSFCPLEILIADTCLFICQFRMAKVRLVNDFVANGYGLLTLDHAKECICLQKGEYMEGAPKACVGAGTGLGECFSTAAPEPGASYETFPSEGGHAEFAPRNDLEMELLNFLKKKVPSFLAANAKEVLRTSISRKPSLKLLEEGKQFLSRNGST